MTTTCPMCARRAPQRGVLCAECASGLGDCDGLLPEHVVARLDGDTADGWLVDGWGQAHPVSGGGTTIGRSLEHSLAVLHASVSREHAELARKAGHWLVRDLGSKNGTLVAGAPIRGRARVENGARVDIGRVPFVFFTGLKLAAPVREAAATTSAPDGFDVALRLRDPESDAELQVFSKQRGGGRDAASGIALCRRHARDTWRELALAPVELALIEALAARRGAAATAPTDSAACISARELAACLPFRSRYPNEENVRQAVKRLRAAFAAAGVDALIETVPRHGYRLVWTAG